MIQIFRRIRRQLLHLNQISMYLAYAIGEIVLVVIGILFALQINNWNQQHKDRKEELYLLQSFHSDLSNDLESLESIIASTQRRSTVVDSVFMILDDPLNYNVEQFLKYQVAVMFDDYFEPNKGTFSESVSSGTVKYIHKKKLREQVFDYYNEISRGRNNDESMYKMTNEHIMPILVQEIFSSKEGATVFGETGAQLPRLDLIQLAKNQKYYQSLIYTKGDQYQLVDWNKYHQWATELKTEIELELTLLNNNKSKWFFW